MSWYQLDATASLNELYTEQDAEPIACPNDGEPLEDGPDGFLYCRFEGWRPPGAPSITSAVRRDRN